MPKQEGQKSKLLALLHIFEQQTDEEHLLNVPQLVELLARQGILCERKSVYSDIDALNALGYDIRLRIHQKAGRIRELPGYLQKTVVGYFPKRHPGRGNLNPVRYVLMKRLFYGSACPHYNKTD